MSRASRALHQIYEAKISPRFESAAELANALKRRKAVEVASGETGGEHNQGYARADFGNASHEDAKSIMQALGFREVDHSKQPRSRYEVTKFEHEQGHTASLGTYRGNTTVMISTKNTTVPHVPTGPVDFGRHMGTHYLGGTKKISRGRFAPKRR